KYFFARAARADEVSGATSGRRSMTSSPLLVWRRRVCAFGSARASGGTRIVGGSDKRAANASRSGSPVGLSRAPVRRSAAFASALAPVASGRAARRVDQLLADSVARERRRAGCARNRIQHGGTDLRRGFEERGEHMFGSLPRKDFRKHFRGTRRSRKPARGLD